MKKKQQLQVAKDYNVKLTIKQHWTEKKIMTL